MKVASAASSTHAMLVMGLARPSQQRRRTRTASRFCAAGGQDKPSGRLGCMPGLPRARQSSGGVGNVDPQLHGGSCAMAIVRVRGGLFEAFFIGPDVGL